MRTSNWQPRNVAVGAALLALAAACGSGSDGGGGAGGAEAGDDSPIRVGVLFSTSGAFQAPSEAMMQGVDHWMEEDGTIGGRPVELVEADDGGTPADAVPAAQRLLQEEQVDIVIGPYLSGPSSAVLPVLNQAQMLNVNMSAFAAAGDAEQFPYTFHVEFTKDVEGRVMLETACELDAASVATIVVNNPLGTEVDASISDNVGDAPCDIDYAGSEQFAAGSTDATAQASAAQDADVVVVAAASTADLATIINSLNEVGFEGYVMSNAQVSNPEMAGLVDEAIHDRVIAFGLTTGTERPLSPEAEEWLTGIREFLGGDPVSRAAYVGWDSMVLLDAAAEGAGSSRADAMKEWLESNEVCGIHACMTFDEDSHDGLDEDDNRPVPFGSAEEGFAETFTP
jgi:branched-chain amino acid transport system substrate-binding protein